MVRTHSTATACRVTAACDDSATPLTRWPASAVSYVRSSSPRVRVVQSSHRTRLLASEQRLRSLRRRLNGELAEQWSAQTEQHAAAVNALLSRFGQPTQHSRYTAAAQSQHSQHAGAHDEAEDEDVRLECSGAEEEHTAEEDRADGEEPAGVESDTRSAGSHSEQQQQQQPSPAASAVGG